jgi:hypothetical protein
MPPPHRTPPPPSIERIVSALLPRSRREQVLGDLKERCLEHPSYATPSYILDALTTLPHVWWSTLRRTLFEPPPKLAAASNTIISERTQQLRERIRIRSLSFSIFWLVLVGVRSIWRIAPNSFSTDPLAHLIIGGVFVLVVIIQPSPWPAYLGRPHAFLIAPLLPADEPTRPELIQSYRTILQAMLRWERSQLTPLFASLWLALMAVYFIPNWPTVQNKGERLMIL